MAGIAELEALASDVGSLFGLEGIVDDIKDVAILGGSAALGFAAANMAFSKVAFLAKQPAMYKSGITIALGVVGGIALKKVHAGLATGFASGLVGFGLYQLAAPYLGMSAPAAGVGEDMLLGTAVYDRSQIPGQMGNLSLVVSDRPAQVGDDMSFAQVLS